MKFRNSFAFVFLLLSFLASAATAATAELKTQFENTDLLISFQGKGTSVSYDVGVIAESQTYLPQLRDQNNQVILTGNSSGAIPVVYFSCHGFDSQSMERFQNLFLTENTPISRALSVLRDSESPRKKLEAFVLKGIPAIDISNLDPYLAAAVGIFDYQSGEVDFNKSTCRPKIPFVSVSANQDILENRKDSKFQLPKSALITQTISDELMKGRNHKSVDYRNFSVNWSKNAHKYFLTDGKSEFQKFYPKLPLGKTPYIGRACTYFADPIMAQLLKQVPEEERLCDIRVVESPKDMAFAIQTTSAEPSYFHPVPESDYQKLDLTQMPQDYRDRTYWGGFIMTLVAQDIRRALPRVRVMGTGLARLDMANEGKFIRAVSLAEADKIAAHSEYWADFVVPMLKETKEKIRSRALTAREEYFLGREEAHKCFEAELMQTPYRESCRTENVVHASALQSAAVASALTYTEEERTWARDKTPLPKARGIRELLKQ